MTKHLKEQRIHYRVSCPHTPQQNGTIERKHRHIIKITLFLLKQAYMPNKFWDEAVCTTTYLINKMPTPILNFKNLFEVLYKTTLDYLFLRTFGILCYPYIIPYALHKRDDRPKACVFLRL